MKQTSGTRYAPGYDLFKLIVAVILTIILIVLLLCESEKHFALLEMTVTPPTETERAVPPTMTSQPPATSTPTLPVTPTEIPATETPTVGAAPTQAASVVVTPPESLPASDPNECPSNPTRIQVGYTVRVLDWLNFRTSPGLGSPIQHTNQPGTEMDVIGGPVCTVRGTRDNPKAYLWWNVRMKDGREGWSAEAPLNYPNYFLEPIR